MQKKHLFLILVILSAFSYKQVYSQRFLGGITVGMNLSQVDGDEFYGFHKVGLCVGPQVSLPFGPKKKWSTTLELLYSQRGSRAGVKYPDSIEDGSYKLNLDYLDIPFLVNFTDKNVISVGAGFSYGVLINVKEWENGSVDDSTTLKGPYSGSDFCVLAEGKVRIWNRLWAGVRYQYSILKIRERHFNNTYQEWDRDQYNNYITLRLTWVFNQEIPRKIKKPKSEKK